MKFTISVFMVDPAQYLDMARAADEWGWDAIAIPDGVFYPEVVTARYPYTPDGSRFWPPDTPYVDPWVAIPAMAAVTKRIRFYSAVLKMAIRQPLLVAKTVASAAVLSNDRVGLGVGLSWAPEEFKFLNEEWANRGPRLDEAIQIMRLVMGGGMVEFHGKHYDFDRLQIAPVPEKPVPIYVGGVTRPALRRAARYGDGWIGAIHTMEQIKGFVAELNRYRREFGREREPFSLMTPCAEVQTVDDIRRLEEIGVTDFQTAPWWLYGGDAERLEVKLDAIKRYAEEVIARFR